MKREDQEPVVTRVDEVHGTTEEHPAFGMVSVNRVSSSHGVSLFDSEVKHQHFITLRISGADRTRNLNRDWIHDDSTPIVEIEMSEAQWASMVSYLNTSGTPCTLSYIKGVGRIPRIPYAPRLAISMEEARGTARQVFARAKEALAAYKDHKTVGNLRQLESAINSAEPNVDFATKSLSEHAEAVVQKAKADIEAMVDSRARQVGIDPHQKVVFQLEDGDDPKELI